jgi:hypothetical protein
MDGMRRFAGKTAAERAEFNGMHVSMVQIPTTSIVRAALSSQIAKTIAGDVVEVNQNFQTAALRKGNQCRQKTYPEGSTDLMFV